MVSSNVLSQKKKTYSKINALTVAFGFTFSPDFFGKINPLLYSEIYSIHLNQTAHDTVACKLFNAEYVACQEDKSVPIQGFPLGRRTLFGNRG